MSEQKPQQTFEEDGTRPIKNTDLEIADTFEEDGTRPIAESPDFLVRNKQKSYNSKDRDSVNSNQSNRGDRSEQSDRTHQKMQQFFAESPVPTESHPYKALEIFWGYNFWQRYRVGFKQKVPVLVITGGRDPSFTQQMGEDLANSFHFGQHFHLPSAGHLSIAEYPQIVNNIISNFIDKINL